MRPSLEASNVTRAETLVLSSGVATPRNYGAGEATLQYEENPAGVPPSQG
jgi:hypothetical protein